MEKVSSDLFTYQEPVFTAEDSTLRGNKVTLGRRFVMVSKKTGREVVFDYYGALYDDEGDLLYQDYVSVTAGVTGFVARVFND